MSRNKLETREQLERWAQIFEHAEWGVVIGSADGKTLEVLNPAFAKMHGYTVEELTGKPILDVFAPDCREQVQEAIQIAYQKGNYTYESEHIRKDGSIFPVIINVTAVKDQDGKLIYWVINLQDITKRKQIEEALAQEKLKQELESKRLRTILDILPVGVLIADGEGAILEANAAAKKLLGEETLCLNKIDEYRKYKGWWPDGKPVTPDEWGLVRALRRGEISSDEEIEIETFDGNRKTILNSAVPIRNETGTIVNAVAVNVDITERKQAEAQIKQLNATLENQVRERTAQLQQTLGFSAVLRRITDRVRDSLDESQILQAAVRELALALNVNRCNAGLYNLEQGTSTIAYEYTSSASAFQKRVLQMSSFPEIYQLLLQGQYFQLCSTISNPIQGRGTMLACPVSDNQGVLGDIWLLHHQPDYAFNKQEIRLVQQVSNQCAIAIRQARLYQAAQAQVKELEKLNRLKDDFLSTVSHELRTPMANIKMAIQMLKVSPSLERGQRYLQILQTECDREIELINDLLDLQRLEANSYPIFLADAINLQDWLPKIIEPFRSRMQERQQILQVHIPTQLPPLVSNIAALERILAELLNNACKYTPASEQIIVTAEAKLGSVQLQVSNSGVEITTHELPRIFDKFYRIPSADRWKQGGTGLGLALAQKLTEHLGGVLQVESSAGQTTFTVDLPNSTTAT